MKRTFLTLILFVSLASMAQEIPGVTKYLTNGRSGLWDMITDTAYIHQYVKDNAAVIDSINVSGDSLFFYSGDLIDTIIMPMQYWHLDESGNITNTNTGFVITDSLFKIYPLPPEVTTLGKIAAFQPNGQLRWTTASGIVGEGNAGQISDPSKYTPWWRDTLNGAIRQAHDTDWVNVDHKLQIGEIKEPAYNLEVTGTSYFSGEMTLRDRVYLYGGGTFLATGNGFINLEGGYIYIKDVIRLNKRTDPPSEAEEGMIYADTDHHLYYYNGSSWVRLD